MSAMLARSTGRFLAPISASVGHARLLARVAVPLLARSGTPTRSNSSTAPASNAVQTETKSADWEDVDHTWRLDYILSESHEPRHETLINKLTDKQVASLPFVIACRSQWKIREVSS